MSEPTEDTIRAIAWYHKPHGWTVYEREVQDGKYFERHKGIRNSGGELGYAEPYTKEIACPPLTTRGALFIYLHECGHVHMGHARAMEEFMPEWQDEYEAEQYAIKAMRDWGIPIPRIAMVAAKRNVKSCIEHDKTGETVPDCILKFAYGSNWRKYR